MDRLSDNIYEVYVGDKIKNVKNISAYTLAWTLFLQIFLGNQRSYKFSFVVSSISGIIAAVSNAIFNFNKKYYNESIENLDNVTKELILLGYDLDDDALCNSTFYVDGLCNSTFYVDGLIEFTDKYDNNYYIYEKEENEYYKYYTLANGDLDACLLDETLHNDITKVIKRGLNKSK